MLTRGRVLLAAGVCLLAVVGGVAAWAAMQDPPRAAVLRAERTSAIWSPIATRALDPAPLTVEELFGAVAVTSGKVTMERLATEALDDCSGAVWGAAADAVAGCTQVLRAGYGTADGRAGGQVDVFNLPDGAAADRLVAALESPSGGFVRPGPGLPGGFDGGRGQAQARAVGHYVTVTWAAPAGSGAAGDLTAHQLALDTVNRALYNRVINAS